MIEQREETRQRPADGAAKLSPIDVTNSVRDGAIAQLAKSLTKTTFSVTLVNLRRVA